MKEPGEIHAPSSNLNTAFRLIKDIQKKYKTREADEKEAADLVKQDRWVIKLFFLSNKAELAQVGTFFPARISALASKMGQIKKIKTCCHAN